MCGIVGYTGQKDSYPILIEMLKKLEYRGYDSAGIAIANPEIAVEKCTGTIGDLPVTNLSGKIGIGHTRWATHGGVCKENAHPHTDCTGELAVVHNGIVENFRELKKELEEKGHKFRSETDTEVVSHLIEEFLKQNITLKEAIEKALSKIEGNYALAVLQKGNNELIVTRKGSPLVIGVGEGENFISSDIPSFLEHTKKVIYLHDGDVVYIPEAQSVHVIGEVLRPGSFPYEEGMTVLKAITLVGGPTQRASTKNIHIKRIENNKELNIKVDMSDLLKPDDIVEVPLSFW